MTSNSAPDTLKRAPLPISVIAVDVAKAPIPTSIRNGRLSYAIMFVNINLRRTDFVRKPLEHLLYPAFCRVVLPSGHVSVHKMNLELGTGELYGRCNLYVADIPDGLEPAGSLATDSLVTIEIIIQDDVVHASQFSVAFA